MPTPTSNHGFRVGQSVNYTYRSAKHPHGTTRKNTTLRIHPVKAFQFGEGDITRHADKVRHR